MLFHHCIQKKLLTYSFEFKLRPRAVRSVPSANAKKSFSLSAALKYANSPTMPNWSKSIFGGTLEILPSGEMIIPFLAADELELALPVLLLILVLFVLTEFLLDWFCEVAVPLCVLLPVWDVGNWFVLDCCLLEVALFWVLLELVLPEEFDVNMLELDEFTLFCDDECCKLFGCSF